MTRQRIPDDVLAAAHARSRARAAHDWAEADRRYRLAMAMWSDWEPLFAPLTASPALAKLCARVGILPEMPLARGSGKDVKPYAHPRYWAAFILIGDPN